MALVDTHVMWKPHTIFELHASFLSEVVRPHETERREYYDNFVTMTFNLGRHIAIRILGTKYELLVNFRFFIVFFGSLGHSKLWPLDRASMMKGIECFV